MLDENVKASVMYMTSICLSLILIYPVKEAQITSLLVKKVKILAKLFSEKKSLILLEIRELNQNAIKLQKDQQPSYKSIYSLGLVKLKTL